MTVKWFWGEIRPINVYQIVFNLAWNVEWSSEGEKWNINVCVCEREIEREKGREG